MIWSLLKAFVFVVLTAALGLGVAWLLEIDDTAILTLMGREFLLTPLTATLAGLILLVAVWLVLRLAGLLVAGLRFLNGDETALSRYLNRRDQARGFEALSDAILALAAGEGRLAIVKAERAAKLLGRPELTNLLIAQGAEMAGDETRATQAFKALLTDDRTRFVGVRGLLDQRLAAGDTDTALKLAQKALALRPRNAGIQDTLLGLQAKYEDWAGARETLATKLKTGTLPRDVHKRRDAVLALAHARDALAMGKLAEASRDATEANRQSPALVPAAVMAARMVLAEGRGKEAASILTKAWRLSPHPDLAAAFAEIAPDETPQARLKRFQALLKLHPEANETRLLEAELHLSAGDFAAARRALGDLPQAAPDARSLTLMAAIERGEGAEDRIIRGYLARAVTASRGPQWLCSACGHVHADWRPTCGQCAAFDSLDWATPAQSESGILMSAQMLPLLVGENGSPVNLTEDQRLPDAPASDVDLDQDHPDPARTAGAVN